MQNDDFLIFYLKLLYFRTTSFNFVYRAMEKIRNSYLYKNYFTDFFENQKPKVKEKILWTIKVVETLQVVPEEYFKHMESTEGL